MTLDEIAERSVEEVWPQHLYGRDTNIGTTAHKVKRMIRAALDEAGREDRATIESLKDDLAGIGHAYNNRIEELLDLEEEDRDEIEQLRGHVEKLDGENDRWADAYVSMKERAQVAEAKLASVCGICDRLSCEGTHERTSAEMIGGLRIALAAERAKVAKLVEALEAMRPPDDWEGWIAEDAYDLARGQVHEALAAATASEEKG